MPGRLALEDGAVFHGQAFGAIDTPLSQTAEVVFNTAMAGYQEALTDPSYSGQILVMTAPLIGNTGVNSEDVESTRVQVSGFVVRELARVYSNYRAEEGLASYLGRNGVLGITGIDTRALTKRLRVAGVMRGVVSNDPRVSDADLVSAARQAPSMEGLNLVPLVGRKSSAAWKETLGEWSPDSRRPSDARPRVLALDCGAKSNILRNLADRGCEVVVAPHSVTSREIRAMCDEGKIDGVFISNGPGDPAAVDTTVRTLRELIGRETDLKSIPMFGICLGHQLLALAAGARTYKLKFGHRGANQPVLNLLNGKVEITSQNHGFGVDPESIKEVGPHVRVTHVNLNDSTVAGFCFLDRPIFSVQYHPEASPGPHDAGYLFDAFVRMMGDRRALPEVCGAAV
jgi:carbamoyl-phosphate synthase small subunit